MDLYKSVECCRACGAGQLANVIALGSQALGGAFPRRAEPDPPQAPLTLVRCTACGLTQLKHSVDVGRLYTAGYGYRSGINATMTQHLAGLVSRVSTLAPLRDDSVVIDIGCNDGTLLNSYSRPLVRVGIDPLVTKFIESYPPDIITNPTFFTRSAVTSVIGDRKADIITSIAMFYDLEDPSSFVADIAATLKRDGIWVLELSYLPSMLERTSYDTICHEHLEYYALGQIEWLAERNGLRAFDAELNHINGGSFRVYLCPQDANRNATERLAKLRDSEIKLRLNEQSPYDAFRDRCLKLRDDLRAFIESEVSRGRRIHAYGASTKGNTILQFCGIDAKLIEAAADRNPEKWGARTPATSIPIVSEEQSRSMKPDYYLALPWHFREEFVAREEAFRARGGKFIFPIPKIEVV